MNFRYSEITFYLGVMRWTKIICIIGIVHASLNAGTIAETAKIAFQQHELNTSFVERQTLLAGFILGNATAELAVVRIDKQNDRQLRIYSFDTNTWKPILDATLHPEVLFADVANMGGLDRLITYEDGQLNWFDPESKKEHFLVEVTSNFNPPCKSEIPHVDITHDLNNDGRDDLVVPDHDGFWIGIQKKDNTFVEPIKIGPPSDLSGIYGADGYRYDPWSQSRIYKIDYNHDDRCDLVYWKEDHFEAHTQNINGLFETTAKTFTTKAAFDSDRFYSLAAGKMSGRVLHSIADLNGDETADLVIYALEGKSISNKRSRFEVYYGFRTPDDNTAFASDAGTTFQMKDRIQLGMKLDDFDRDGQVDLMLTTIDRKILKGSIWKRIKGFMGEGIGLNLEFYKANDGLYPEQPNTTRGIGLIGASDHRTPGWVPLDIALRGGTHESRKKQKGWERAFNKNLLIGDVTGDGRSDLLIEATFRGLQVYVGVPKTNLFSVQPQEVKVVVPNDGEYTWLVDLNKDGKQDILMHHPFTLRDIHGTPIKQPGTEPHRVTLLIAQ